MCPTIIEVSSHALAAAAHEDPPLPWTTRLTEWLMARPLEQLVPAFVLMPLFACLAAYLCWRRYQAHEPACNERRSLLRRARVTARLEKREVECEISDCGSVDNHSD